MLDAADVVWLGSTGGRQALEAAAELQPRQATFLTCLQKLERQWPRRQAALALDQVLLRQRAAAKFPLAGSMLFERQALERSTSSTIAVHRAARFAGVSAIFDLARGLGGDSLALAVQAPVTAIDKNGIRLICCAMAPWLRRQLMRLMPFRPTCETFHFTPLRPRWRLLTPPVGKLAGAVTPPKPTNPR
jgi:hypothetical protein